MKSKNEIIAELRQIPGVGISIANDLYNIGIRGIDDLRSKNPEKLYDQSNDFAGIIQDRCLLYVFREAVYYAETPPSKRDTEKLKWWNWKDTIKKTSKKPGQTKKHLLGPVSSRWLCEAGIFSMKDVEKLGVVNTYVRVKRLYPDKVSLNLLYGLEAERLGVHWTKLPADVKRQLKVEAEEFLSFY